MDVPNRLLALDDALAAIRHLVELSALRVERFGRPVVLIGDSAMAAHGARPLSDRIDLWVPEFSEAVVHEVEDDLRHATGDGAKLDVTSTDNLWGPLRLRDIAASPILVELPTTTGPVEVRALRAEDLVLLHLAAGRAKSPSHNPNDLELLAPCTNVDVLLARFERVVAWHGDRHGPLEFADAVLRFARQLGAPAASIIERLAVPEAVRAVLRSNGGRAAS